MRTLSAQVGGCALTSRIPLPKFDEDMTRKEFLFPPIWQLFSIRPRRPLRALRGRICQSCFLFVLVGIADLSEGGGAP